MRMADNRLDASIVCMEGCLKEESKQVGIVKNEAKQNHFVPPPKQEEIALQSISSLVCR